MQPDMALALVPPDPGDCALQPAVDLGIGQDVEPAEIHRLQHGYRPGYAEIQAHRSGRGFLGQFLLNGGDDPVAPQFDLAQHGLLVEIVQWVYRAMCLGLRISTSASSLSMTW